MYQDFITGKSVAIVGPAAYMAGSGLGDEIDSHDVVVRINRSIETIDEFEKDIGRRCDILYSCLIETPMQAGTIDPKYLRDRYDIKYICAPPASSMAGIAPEPRFHDMIDLKKLAKIREYIPVRLVDNVFHTNLASFVNCRPNTGFLAIYDLMVLRPSKLSVYGFSFYLDGFIKNCKSGIEEVAGISEIEFANNAFNSKRHVQINMWNFAKDTLLTVPEVELDDVLESILRMETFSKEEFERISHG